MVRATFRVFGKDGHRQRASFGDSFEFSVFGGHTHIECVCEDRTLSNEYVDVIITADSFKSCADELNAQLTDGIFEACTTGCILIRDIEKEYGCCFKSIKNEIVDVMNYLKS